MVSLRYAARVNGLDELALTKLDVLSGLKTLKVATAYERGAERVDHFPAEFGVESLAQWRPIYEDLPVWGEVISDVRRRADLPRAAQRYVARIEELTGIPVTFIGVGPERKQAIAGT